MRGTITTIKTEPITAEKINQNRDDWNLTLSRKLAELGANSRQVYRLPNGVYAFRKSTKSDRNCARVNKIWELVRLSDTAIMNEDLELFKSTEKRIQEINAQMEL